MQGYFQLENLTTGKKTEWQPNILTDSFYDDWIPDLYGAAFTSQSAAYRVARIALGATNITPSRGDTQLVNTLAVTFNPPSSDRVQFVEFPPFGADPYFVIEGFVDPIGINRTFNSIALTNAASNNDLASTIVSAFALANLDTPCLQGPVDTIIARYRIPVQDIFGQGLGLEASKIIYQKLFDDSTANLGVDAWFPSASIQLSPVSAWTKLFNKTVTNQSPLITSNFTGPAANTWDASTYNSNIYAFEWSKDVGLQDYIGVIFNSIVTGKTNTSDPIEPNLALGVVPFRESAAEVGPVFRHTAASDLPFFDAANQPSAPGVVSANIANWETQNNLAFPEYWDVEITTGGAIGTSEYKLKKRYFTGFQGNTFLDAKTPFIFSGFQATDSAGEDGSLSPHIVSTETGYVYRYSSTKVSQYNLMTGEVKTEDSFTDIAQVEFDPANPQVVSVADRTDGLYEINFTTSSPVISQLSSDPCLGVAYSQNERYAVFGGTSGRIAQAPNFNTALPFTYTGISNNNWGSVNYLKAYQDTDDHLVIFADDMVFFDGTNTILGFAGISTFSSSPADTAVAKSEDILSTKYAIVSGSILRFGFFEFGNSTVINISSFYNGVQALGQLTFAGNYAVTHANGTRLYEKQGSAMVEVFVKPTNPPIGSFSTSNTGRFHVGGGIISDGDSLLSFVDSGLFDVEYGWNSSNWVEGNGNSRVTHTAAESIPGGAEVSFSGGFDATDFYTFTVSYGTVKTNAHTFTFGYTLYGRPTKFDAQNAVFNVPPSPHQTTLTEALGGFFVAVDTRPELWDITIDGLEPTVVYHPGNPGTPSAVGEVLLAYDGTVTFFSGDEGKAVDISKYPAIFFRD